MSSVISRRHGQQRVSDHVCTSGTPLQPPQRDHSPVLGSRIPIPAQPVGVRFQLLRFAEHACSRNGSFKRGVVRSIDVLPIAVHSTADGERRRVGH